jgi:hypothetical protein
MKRATDMAMSATPLMMVVVNTLCPAFTAAAAPRMAAVVTGKAPLN